MKEVRCPVQGCDYWCSFGGYLAPMLSAFKRHVQKDHRDLGAHDTRATGGIIDRAFGEAIQEAYSIEVEL